MNEQMADVAEWQADAVEKATERERRIEELTKDNNILRITTNDAEERMREKVDEAAKLIAKLDRSEEKNKELLHGIGTGSAGALQDQQRLGTAAAVAAAAAAAAAAACSLSRCSLCCCFGSPLFSLFAALN